MPLLLTSLLALAPIQSLQAEETGFGTWTRNDRHDGYVLGDGKMYSVAGLGRALKRTGKSYMVDEPTGLTRIAWVIGPHYTLGNLGYGWDINPTIDGEPRPWTEEGIRNPTEEMPFWGVKSQSPALSSEVTDMILPGEAVMLRRVAISRPRGAPAARVMIDIPVFADRRNARYCMFNGEEVLEGIAERYRDSCGDQLKPRPSVPVEDLQQIDAEAGTILHLGAPRALWQEVSTRVPSDSVYSKLFPPRAMATTVVAAGTDIRVSVDQAGFHVDLGLLEGGAQREFGIWIAAAAEEESSAAEGALRTLAEWSHLDMREVLEMSKRQQPESLVRVEGAQGRRMVEVIDACANLIIATQSHAGGVMAQPYMYPMYYVRDQYGSFRMLLSLGEHERALKVLQFYVGMQNREGIQNAHDSIIEPPDPNNWDSAVGLKDGRWSAAEVPSYIVLMARDYLRWTNDLERVAPLYGRLAYNVRVQQVNENHLLPWAHDESYTNSRHTRPVHGEEMTDSTLLFLGATKFMAGLAKTIGRAEDVAEFEGMYTRTKAALLDRLWLEDEDCFAYSRDASDDPSAIDRRPALDSLLRWTQLGLGVPGDSVSRACYDTVLEQLVDPIRVVPEVSGFTAGMDPGYVLFAASKLQHPTMHAAAQTLLSYASDTGLFSEYYSHELETSVIQPFSGTLRPWESAVCGHALLQYLVGLNVELDKRRISVQPHLPRGSTGWTTKEIELFGEGTIQISLRRIDAVLEFTVTRHGGVSDLEVHVELGGLEGAPRPVDGDVHPKAGRPDLLTSTFVLAGGAPGDDLVRHSLRIKLQ